MCDESPGGAKSEIDGNERGFTLIEMLISIMITLIVMASVFALLTRGQRTFRREPEIADLQQSARTALDMVSRDLMQAGSGLPPEYPIFTRVNGAGNGATTDVIEMVGLSQSSGNPYVNPEEIMNMTGNDVFTLGSTSSLDVGNIVVVYNDVPNNDAAVPPRRPQWAMGRVLAKDESGPNARLTLDYAEFDPGYSNHVGGPGNPPNWVPDFAPNATLKQVPRITRVTIVRYFTQPDDPSLYSGPPPELLMRLVRDNPPDAPPSPVGHLEDFQIAYIIGNIAPLVLDDPPSPVDDVPAGTPMTAENMLSSVRITVTARSVSINLEGASEGASAGTEDNFVRKTFSTNVNPRNLTAGLEWRAINNP